MIYCVTRYSLCPHTLLSCASHNVKYIIMRVKNIVQQRILATPSADHPISIHTPNFECISPFQRTKIDQLVPIQYTHMHARINTYTHTRILLLYEGKNYVLTFLVHIMLRC